MDAGNPRVFGKYEVLRRLAVGGMGEIFLARQTGMAGFDRLVILKSLLPQLASDSDMLTQFLDEARIVGSINHPNVVACYEVGEWEGVYFIAMEYINGVDIATLAKAADENHVRFPIHVALAVVREAALGLDSAHHAIDAMGRALKIVHRDISPHNVMVRQDGLAKVVDFGVAVAATRMRRTEGGLLKGKLGYMAPEQIKGQPLDGRADQFSLGVMLWELLAGRRLFVADDPHAVFMKIVRETVPAPSSVTSDIPKELDAIVVKMTAQEPADRYPRLADAAAAIRKVLDASGKSEADVAETVKDLVGGQLAERVRDLTPVAVKILGIQFERAEPEVSGTFCKSCGAQAVKGDRFCRSCGSAIARGRTPTGHPPPMPPVPASSVAAVGGPMMLDDDFADAADDVIDVAFDDAIGPAEAAVCVGVLELVDGAGVHNAPESMLRAVVAHVEELASRFGGTVSTSGARLIANFGGNGRAARSAVAFARRATSLAMRANASLRMRAGVAAVPSAGEGDTRARDDAERTVNKARPGTILVGERARKLAGIAHEYGASVSVPLSAASASTSGVGDVLTAYELPTPPRFAGRAGERIIIEQAVAAADVGRGQQNLFLGAAGLGKSALLDLAEAEARDRGFVVARARSQRGRAPLRYDLVRQAIESACKELAAVAATSAGDASLSSSPSSNTSVWSKALDGLAISDGDRRRLVALVEDASPNGASASAPDTDDVPLVRRRVALRAALIGFFAAVADRRGVCIIVDDVHKGDPSSLEVFAEVAARLHASRCVIFAAGMPMKGERILPLARRSVLEPLEQKDCALVASWAAAAAPGGVSLPEASVEKIATRAKGNPLFATLLARHLVAMRLVKSEDLAHYPLPPSIEVCLFALHALLPPAAGETLVAAASIGGTFASADVAAMLDGVDVGDALSACVQTGALVVNAAGEFSFPSSTERDVVAARVDPVAARAWHARIADALAKHAAASGSTQVALRCEERVLQHRLAADDKSGAAASAERAAEAWAKLGAPEATTEHYRRALQAAFAAAVGRDVGGMNGGASVDADRANKALDLAARATRVLTEVDAGFAVDLAMPLLRALPIELAPAGRTSALSARSSALLKLRRSEDAESMLDAALDGFAEGAGAAVRASLLVDLAGALELSGNLDAARAQLQEAVHVMSALPEKPRAVEALVALARLHLRARDGQHARETIQQALDEAKKKNAPAWLRIEALTALAALEQQESRPAQALNALEEAASTAQKASDAVAEAKVKQQIARLHQQTGRFTEALASARQSLSTAQRLAWDEGIAVASQLVTSLEQRQS